MSEEAKVTMMVSVAGGARYDINNLPGVIRDQLIQEGKLAAERFNVQDNVPGVNRKPVAKVEDAKENVNTYQVGDTVIFRKHASEVLEAHPKKGLKIRLKEGKKSKWIHFSKVQEVRVKEE
jgi:hypothetical protein